MPLDASTMVQNGNARHTDVLQFVQLLTGTMTDQPVTITNTITVGSPPSPFMLGAIPVGMPAIAAAGQALSFATNGVARWQVTTGGDLQASSNNVYNIGGTALNQPRSIYVATSVQSPLYNVGGATRYINFNTATGFDSLNIVDRGGVQTGYVQIYADEAPIFNFNINPADGTPLSAAWPFGRLVIGASYGNGVISYETGGAGATSATQKWVVDWQGNSTFQGSVSVGATSGTLTANHNLAVGGNILMNPASTIIFNNGAYIAQYEASGTDHRVVVSALTVTPGPTATGNLAVNGSTALAGGDVHVGAPHSLYVDGGNLFMGNGTIQFVNTIYGHNNGTYLDASAGTGWSLHGTLQVDGSTNFLAGVGFNNLDLYYTRNIYGQNNVGQITNDGNYNWSLYNNLSIASNLTVNGALNTGGGVGIGGETLTLNQYGTYPNGIISTAGGPLYVRSAQGTINMDSGPLFVTNGAVTATACIGQQWTAGPTHFFAANNSGPYIQAAGNAIRYDTVGASVNSFESQGGGFSPCQASAFNPVSARRFKADIVTLDDPLDMVLDERVHAVRYTNIWTDEPSLGFVAEDWLGVLPEVVDLNDDGDVMALDYDRISAVTFEALKQHVIKTNARLDALERMLAA